MGMRQSVLPVSHGMRGGNSRGGASRVTRREQILLSLVLFLGGAVWCFAMYSSGGPQLPDSSKTVQQSGGSDKLAEVVPRRLSDVDELKANSHDPAASMGTKHAPGEEQPDAITNVHDTAKGGKLHLPNAQHSPDASHIPTLSSLETLQDITTGSNQDAPLLPPSKPEAPSTVAELIAVSVSCSYGQQYAAQPVKIKNSQTDWWKAEDWTIDAVRQQIGDHSVFRSIRACKEGQKDRQSKRCHRVKEKDPEMLGKTWAAMTEVDLKKEKISNYNDLFDKQIELGEQQRYIYAQEVGPRWLLDFVARLHQPKYFMNNIGDVSMDNNPDPRSLLFDNIFPAYFFGPAGSQSPLHSDASMTRFWILELTGTKIIRLVPPSNNWRADATDQDDFQPELFTADILIPDFEEHPRLNGMVIYETLLEPGDIIYIPEGWAHQALNLDWTCMASYNYNDENNLQNRLSYMRYDRKPEVELTTELNARHFYFPLINMSKDVGNMPIVDYFHMNSLEFAPVSDAARAHIAKLKYLEIEPTEWRDSFSRPVMFIAVTHNYIALAKWLVEEGVPLENDSNGRYLLKGVEAELKLKAMAEWMRQHMGVDDSDDLSDVDLEDEKAFKNLK